MLKKADFNDIKFTVKILLFKNNVCQHIFLLLFCCFTISFLQKINLFQRFFSSKINRLWMVRAGHRTKRSNTKKVFCLALNTDKIEFYRYGWSFCFAIKHFLIKAKHWLFLFFGWFFDFLASGFKKWKKNVLAASKNEKRMF